MRNMEDYINSAIDELGLLNRHLLAPDSIEYHRVNRIIHILNSAISTGVKNVING